MARTSKAVRQVNAASLPSAQSTVSTTNNPKLKLCLDNLGALATRVPVPAYNPKTLTRSVVHIGVGGFNRAHQAVYLDDVLHRAEGETWGECGIGLLPSDARMEDVLRAQDFLYTAVEYSVEGVQARVVASICDFVLATSHPHQAIEVMASPECRIVGLTITEGSYLFDGVTGIFEDQHPHVLHDLANPAEPRSFLGYISEALDRRRRRGLAPFTVMSCDNLPENGHAAQYVVTSFAEMRSPALRSWIEQNVAFPNSMVDRITPATTNNDRRLLSERFGIEDQWPVVSERFRQWVIEDKFCNGRPPWELAGVQFTTDVRSFEAVKVRLLNGSHFAMAYLSSLIGYRFVHEVMADDRMRRYLEAFMNEVTPAVPVASGTNLTEYKAMLIHRFSNPALCDQLQRICAQGSAKISKFLLPSLELLLGANLPTRILALTIASWLHYMRGQDEQGRPIEINDAGLAETRRLLGSSDPVGPDMLRFLLGPKLALDLGFADLLRTALVRLQRDGVVTTIDWCLNGS